MTRRRGGRLETAALVVLALRLAAPRHRVGRGRGAGGRLARVVGAREARRAAGDVPDRAGRLGRGDRGADPLAGVADRHRVDDVRRPVQRAVPVAPPAAGSHGLLSGGAAGGGLPQLRDRRRPRLAAVRPRLRGDRRLTGAAGAGRDLLGADGQPLPRGDPRRAAARPRRRARRLLPDRRRRRARPTTGCAPALERFCEARRERLEETLATRHTQTNETARCSALLPAFASVADGRPLAQIEIGASAGLNGLWDHYAYDYDGRAAGEAGSPLQIACELVGPVVPPLEPPPVAWRAGIDRSPVDLRDEADVRWLRACLWPDQAARHARLRGGAAGRPRARAGRDPPRRRARAPPRRHRRGARRRARLRLPHRDAHLLRRGEDRRAAAAARGARRRVDRRRGARAAGGGEHRPDPALRADGRPRRRAEAARPHGPPRRLARVVLDGQPSGVLALEAA